MRKILIIVFILVVILVAAALLAVDRYTSQASFCGSCHIMKTYYESWEASRHGRENISCMECHYNAGEMRDGKEYFKGVRQLFTYLSFGKEEARVPTRISDQSCLTYECHFTEIKNVKFANKNPFIHPTHLQAGMEGEKLHCDTCHTNEKGEDHFEVSREVCFLCHFINKSFNKGLARCSLCHEIPADPLQSHKRGFTGVSLDEAELDENRITHQSLEKAEVPCQVCHYKVVRGKGGTDKQKCFKCHGPSLISGTESGKDPLAYTHAEGMHVARQQAKCLDCHEPVQHKKIEFLDPVVENCSVCHPDHHKFQKSLLLGTLHTDAAKTPGLMYDIKTNCVGCHRDEKLVKGEKVLYGSAKACAACHTERHEAMVREWNNKTGKELTHAKELEALAAAAIENANGRVSEETMNKAVAMLNEGREFIDTVEYGGGVHNKRYAIRLLDFAMNRFEGLLVLLKE
jgi:formate-dependent nitrite reductase cytochrome c552 subunit